MNPRNVDELYNLIGYVVLCAPDRFPYRDYLPKDQQMTLDRAFEELRSGIPVAENQDWPIDRKAALESLLDRSLVAYREGDDKMGAHLLQDFQNHIFKTER